jgi:hypothetical protein
MKFNVTFRCSLPIDFDKHPAGEELAAYIAAKLSEQGLNFQHIDNHEDFAWELVLKHRSPAPWLLVGYVDDDVYEWLVLIISGTHWFDRLFGRTDQELREAVAKKLHGILTTDPHFSDVRWHQGDFGEAGWTSSPVEPESTQR